MADMVLEQHKINLLSISVKEFDTVKINFHNLKQIENFTFFMR